MNHPENSFNYNKIVFVSVNYHITTYSADVIVTSLEFRNDVIAYHLRIKDTTLHTHRTPHELAIRVA